MFAKSHISPLLSLLMALTLSACKPEPKMQYITTNSEALGTFAMVKCNTDKGEDVIYDLVESIDKEAKASMSIFDETSLLSRINRGETDELDKHIERNIEIAGRFTELSDGVYDITIKPLTEAWGFAGGNNEDSEPNIDSLLQFVGFDKISVKDGKLIRSDRRVQLDFNSIAKGYTVDLVAEELEAMGIEEYLVNIGGEIRCKGVNDKGEPWSIAIETPYDGNVAMDSYEKILRISDCGLATSGNYRRFYYTDEGEKVTHTIDPRTGRSVVSALLSATVIAPTCAEADAAATMFMAMGSEGGALELAQRCERELGWRYYFIYANGEKYRIECSDEFKEE